MGVSKKNPKIHFSHLQGRRAKVMERYNSEKRRSKEQNIQYDSSSTLLNSSLLQSLKHKHDFVKNKYKYSDMKSTTVGRYNRGVLSLSKFDLEKINGKGADREDTGGERRGGSFKHKKGIKKSKGSGRMAGKGKGKGGNKF